jgi:signal transduction histidine kinase
LPILITLPLIALVLIYVLETRVLLAGLSEELIQQAAFTADFAASQPLIWEDTAQAQIFVTRFSARNNSEVTLIDSGGTLVASNDPGNTDQLGQQLEGADLASALAGNESAAQVNYSLNLQAEIVEVLYPVPGPNQEIIGIVRLTRELASVYDRFLNLRYLVLGILAAELFIAAILGLALALNLGRWLARVTDAIYAVAGGREWTTLPEKGPKEIRLLLQAFNTLIERLQVLEESRRRLLANLVHEVSRPIGALQSTIQALLGGADQDAALRRELLAGMAAEVERLRPLLDNLAELHGQVLGTLELNRRATDLNEWLSQTARPWREAAHADGLHWEIEISETLPTLEIDPDRLAQVLGNLISNAIKYTPSGGTVSISAGLQNDEVWIQVGDTGRGIARVEHEQIFEPFYRSNRDHRFPQGMGLGLTIAHDLVVAHGGRLVVASEPNQGSRFTLWLPLETAAPDQIRS